MYSQALQINGTRAISLASENPQYLSMKEGYNSTFASIFETGSLDKINCNHILMNVNVGYVLSNQNGYAKNLVVTLDPTLSRVTNVTSYVGQHYFSNPNWSGYEVSADGGSSTTLTFSKLNYSIPAISQPPSSANSKSCISPSIGCDLAVWTGLEDQLGSANLHLAQGGSDGNMTCTSIGSCTAAKYFLWFEFLPYPAFDCFNSNIKSGDSITDTVSNNGNSVYSISVVDNTASATCASIQHSYLNTTNNNPMMTNPKFAPFISERATLGTTISPHRDEVAKFSPVQMGGVIGFSNTQSSITPSLIVATDTMVNPPTSSGTTNISIGGIVTGAFTQSWLSSDNTNTCFPSSGLVDWIVISSCALDFSAQANANVIMQNNSVLTIPKDLTLTLNFKTNHLLVNSGSGVLLQPGGKISN